LVNICPLQAYKVKLQQPAATVERHFAAWVGGSILASLGSFQQMWFSRAEFNEYGAALLERKCP
jgi:actin-like protein 6A